MDLKGHRKFLSVSTLSEQNKGFAPKKIGVDNLTPTGVLYSVCQYAVLPVTVGNIEISVDERKTHWQLSECRMGHACILPTPEGLQ